MSHFICAVHTESGVPTAYSIVEQVLDRKSGSRPHYEVRALARFESEEPIAELQDALAADEQLTGQIVIVTDGGRPAAEGLARSGMTSVPVEIMQENSSFRAQGTIRVAAQNLVDTFETAFRNRRVVLPDGIENADAAVRALYLAASDEAGAEDASPELEALSMEEEDGESAEVPSEVTTMSGDTFHASEREIRGSADVPTLTGSSDGLSATEIREDRENDPRGRRSTANALPLAPGAESRGQTTTSNPGTGSVELGENEDVALCLALACWYGEYSADELPVTDQATRTPRQQQVRGRRRPN
jgi:hypothetical protein